MVGWGEKLDAISQEALQRRLHEATDRTATLRLVVAIEYKDGTPVEKIAAKYDVPRATIYDWLDRFEERGLDDALYDASPPGKKRALTASQQRDLETALRRPPTVRGYEVDGWTTALAQEYVEDRFGISYSRRHVVRLLREAGLEPRRVGANDDRDDPDSGRDARTVWKATPNSQSDANAKSVSNAQPGTNVEP